MEGQRININNIESGVRAPDSEFPRTHNNNGENKNGGQFVPHRSTAIEIERRSADGPALGYWAPSFTRSTGPSPSEIISPVVPMIDNSFESNRRMRDLDELLQPNWNNAEGLFLVVESTSSRLLLMESGGAIERLSSQARTRSITIGRADVELSPRRQRLLAAHVISPMAFDFSSLMAMSRSPVNTAETTPVTCSPAAVRSKSFVKLQEDAKAFAGMLKDITVNRKHLKTLSSQAGIDLTSSRNRMTYMAWMEQTTGSFAHITNGMKHIGGENIDHLVRSFLCGFVQPLSTFSTAWVVRACYDKLDPRMGFNVKPLTKAEMLLVAQRETGTTKFRCKISLFQHWINGTMYVGAHVEEGDDEVDLIDFHFDFIFGKSNDIEKVLKNHIIGDVATAIKTQQVRGNLDLHNSKVINQLVKANAMRDYQIPSNTSDAIVDALSLAWPNRTFIKSSNKADNGHAYHAANRDLVRENLVMRFPKSGLVVDIGGAYSSHIRSGFWNVHSCFPVLDENDAKRKMENDTGIKNYIHDTETMMQSSKSVVSADRREAVARIKSGKHAYWCHSKAQNCGMVDKSGTSFGVSIDTLFYMKPEDMVAVMKAHNIIYGLHAIIVPPTFMYETSGKLAFNEGQWRISKGTFEMVTNGCSGAYHSSAAVMKTWLTTPLFVGEGFGLYVRNEGYMGSHMLLKIMRVPYGTIMQHMVRHCLWLTGNPDEQIYNIPIIDPEKPVTLLWKQPFTIERLCVNSTMLSMLKGRLSMDECNWDQLSIYARGLRHQVYTSQTGRVMQFNMSEEECRFHMILAMMEHHKLMRQISPLIPHVENIGSKGNWWTQAFKVIKNMLIKMGRTFDPTDDEYLSKVMKEHNTLDEYKMSHVTVSEVLKDVSMYTSGMQSMSKQNNAAISYHGQNRINATWVSKLLDSPETNFNNPNGAKVHAHYHSKFKTDQATQCKPQLGCPHDHRGMHEHDIGREEAKRGNCLCCGILSPLFANLCEVCRTIEKCHNTSSTCKHQHNFVNEHCCGASDCQCVRNTVCICCGKRSLSSPCLLCDDYQPHEEADSINYREQIKQAGAEIFQNAKATTIKTMSQHSRPISDWAEHVEEMEEMEREPEIMIETTVQGGIMTEDATKTDRVRLLTLAEPLEATVTNIHGVHVVKYVDTPDDGTCGFTALEQLPYPSKLNMADLQRISHRDDWWSGNDLGMFCVSQGVNLLVVGTSTSAYYQGDTKSNQYGAIVHMTTISGEVHWNACEARIMSVNADGDRDLDRRNIIGSTAKDRTGKEIDEMDVVSREEFVTNLLAEKQWLSTFPASTELNRLMRTKLVNGMLEAESETIGFHSTNGMNSTKRFTADAGVEKGLPIYITDNRIPMNGSDKPTFVKSVSSCDDVMSFMSPGVKFYFYGFEMPTPTNAAYIVPDDEIQGLQGINNTVVNNTKNVSENQTCTLELFELQSCPATVVLGMARAHRRIDFNEPNAIGLDRKRPNWKTFVDIAISARNLGVKEVYLPMLDDDFDVDEFDALVLSMLNGRSLPHQIKEKRGKAVPKMVVQPLARKALNHLINNAGFADVDMDILNFVKRESVGMSKASGKFMKIVNCGSCGLRMLKITGTECSSCGPTFNMKVSDAFSEGEFIIMPSKVGVDKTSNYLNGNWPCTADPVRLNGACMDYWREQYQMGTNSMIEATMTVHENDSYHKKSCVVGSCHVKNGQLTIRANDIKECSAYEPFVVQTDKTWSWAFSMPDGTIATAARLDNGPVRVIGSQDNIGYCLVMACNFDSGRGCVTEELNQMVKGAKAFVGVPGGGKTRGAKIAYPKATIVTKQAGMLKTFRAEGRDAVTPAQLIARKTPTDCVILDEAGLCNYTDLWPMVGKVNQLIITADINQNNTSLMASNVLTGDHTSWLSGVQIEQEFFKSYRFGPKTAQWLKRFNPRIEGVNSNDKGITWVHTTAKRVEDQLKELVGRNVDVVLVPTNADKLKLRKITNIKIETMKRFQGQQADRIGVFVTKFNPALTSTKAMYTCLSRHKTECIVVTGPQTASLSSYMFGQNLDQVAGSVSRLAFERFLNLPGPIVFIIKLGAKITWAIQGLLRALARSAQHSYQALKRIMSELWPQSADIDDDLLYDYELERVLSQESRLMSQADDEEHDGSQFGPGPTIRDDATSVAPSDIELNVIDPTPELEQEEFKDSRTEEYAQMSARGLFLSPDQLPRHTTPKDLSDDVGGAKVAEWYTKTYLWSKDQTRQAIGKESRFWNMADSCANGATEVMTWIEDLVMTVWDGLVRFVGMMLQRTGRALKTIRRWFANVLSSESRKSEEAAWEAAKKEAEHNRFERVPETIAISTASDIGQMQHEAGSYKKRRPMPTKDKWLKEEAGSVASTRNPSSKGQASPTSVKSLVQNIEKGRVGRTRKSSKVLNEALAASSETRMEAENQLFIKIGEKKAGRMIEMNWDLLQNFDFEVSWEAFCKEWDADPSCTTFSKHSSMFKGKINAAKHEDHDYESIIIMTFSKHIVALIVKLDQTFVYCHDVQTAQNSDSVDEVLTSLMEDRAGAKSVMSMIYAALWGRMKIRIIYWQWYLRTWFDFSYKAMISEKIELDGALNLHEWAAKNSYLTILKAKKRVTVTISGTDALILLNGQGLSGTKGARPIHLIRLRRGSTVNEVLVEEIGDVRTSDYVRDTVKKLLYPSYFRRHARARSNASFGGAVDILGKYWSRLLGARSGNPVQLSETWNEIKHNLPLMVGQEHQNSVKQGRKYKAYHTIRDTNNLIDIDPVTARGLVACCIPSGAGKTTLCTKEPDKYQDIDDLMTTEDFADINDINLNEGMFLVTKRYRSKVQEWIINRPTKRILLCHHPEQVEGLINNVLVVIPKWDLGKAWSDVNNQRLIKCTGEKIGPSNHDEMETMIDLWAETRLRLSLRMGTYDSNEPNATAIDWFLNTDQTAYNEIKLPTNGSTKSRLPVYDNVKQHVTVIGHAPPVTRPVIVKYINQLYNSITTRIHGEVSYRKQVVDPVENFERVAKTFFKPGWEAMVEEFVENPVLPGYKLTEEWLSMKGDPEPTMKEIKFNILDDFNRMPYNKCKLHLKSETLLKEQVDRFEDQIGRVIVWHPKPFCAVLCPVINLMKERFKLLLDKEKIVYTDGCDMNEIQFHVQDLHPDKVIEMDLKKQDRQTDMHELENEFVLMTALGFPSYLMPLWRAYNENWRYKASDMTESWQVGKRKTGDEMTSLGNTFKNMSGIAEPFVRYNTERVLILSDDMIAFGRTDWDQRWVEDHLRDKFNVQCEWAGGKSGKFCQLVVSPVRGFGFIVAADIKRLADKFRVVKSSLTREDEDWDARCYSYLSLIGPCDATNITASKMNLPRPVQWARSWGLRLQANAEYHKVTGEELDRDVNALCHNMMYSGLEKRTFNVLGTHKFKTK
ncbi:polyprotein [Alternaria brassicicola endornavirus 1]|uniref:Polyprotein n=1 Tax=Alternaria brassicicola endornavirus 1 TaxID=2755034 RepID=A0A0A7RRY5_9VIRU|nr:polyprotein [Alternaria brassicicola betaendornavirus 1]AJA41110.1 polyprotein [Alternaria brassicicola betaendornavirus 1]